MRRYERVLAWSLWSVALILCVMLVWLTILSADSPGPLEYDETPAILAIYIFLRDEVELFTALSSKLTGVVAETMQPAHVSLWLRGVGSVQ